MSSQPEEFYSVFYQSVFHKALQHDSEIEDRFRQAKDSKV